MPHSIPTPNANRGFLAILSGTNLRSSGDSLLYVAAIPIPKPLSSSELLFANSISCVVFSVGKSGKCETKPKPDTSG